jgi:hypothetical protein
MEASTFTDYYEVLEVSPNANSETIDRIFRYLAQRCHPDNQDTGDRLRFDAILQAHNTLKDPALYVKRRKDANDPGIGSVELERLLRCPTKQLEFHIWYLKEKGWIKRLDNGLLAITVEGIDRTYSEHRGATTRLLTDQDRTGQVLHMD